VLLRRTRPWLAHAARWLGAAAIVLLGATAATASHMSDWTHDHSSSAIPSRPQGYRELVDAFGQPCNSRANDARSYWPHQGNGDVPGYVYYHVRLERNIGFNIRNHIEAAHLNGALYPLIGAYNCRYISGTTQWSVHAFGAAVDTNSQRNPMGQDFWNGRGADGIDHGRYVPDVWRGPDPGHHFFWGLNWPTRPDPMHFQFVTDY
jgi:hypothetical protein